MLLEDLNEQEKNDSRVQAIVKWSKHKNLSIFIFCQD